MTDAHRTSTCPPGTQPNAARNTGRVARGLCGAEHGKLEGHRLTRVGPRNHQMHPAFYERFAMRRKARRARPQRTGHGRAGVLAGMLLGAAFPPLPAAAVEAPPALRCTEPGGCEVTCYRAGAVDIPRSIVMQRSGVQRVEPLASGWLQVTVEERAYGPDNYSGVIRLADTATCWFARMVPAR